MSDKHSTDTGKDFKSAKSLCINAENVDAIIVEDGNGRRWSWNLGHYTKLDHKKYGQVYAILQRVVVGNYSSTGKRWYLMGNADCFSPPMALIQADSDEEAVEIFDDECEDWVKVEEPDLKDYITDEWKAKYAGKDVSEQQDDEDCPKYSDSLSWNSSGVPIDHEGLIMLPVTRVILYITPKAG